MSNTFNADEIFEIAEQIERNGAKFYRRAAELFPGSQIHDKLQTLASMEDQHEKTFAAMRAELQPADPSGQSFDPDNQAAMYLQSVADGKVFDLSDEPSNLFPEGITLEEVIKTAIEIEKESVVFYTGIKKIVPEDLGSDRIDSIIMEEVGHIIDLRVQLRELEN